MLGNRLKIPTHSYSFTRSAKPYCQCGAISSVQHILACPNHQYLRRSLPVYQSLLIDSMGIDSLSNTLPPESQENVSA